MRMAAARFAEEDYKALLKACKERRETVSNFLRRAAIRELARLGFLPNEAGDKRGGEREKRPEIDS